MTRQEAIDKLKHLCSPEQMTALKVLVPELQESEDERIRKELIEFIKWSVDRHFMREDFHQAKRPLEWIAYLERQKYEYEVFEPIENTLEYKAGFKAGIESEKQKEQKVDINKLRRDLYQSGYNDGYQHGKEDAKKEQKPLTTEETELNSIAFLEQLGYTCIPPSEQKPAEHLDDNVDEDVELTPFESALFSAFSDAWQEYMHGEPVNVAHWAKEHSEALLEVAKGDSAKWSEEIAILEGYIVSGDWSESHKERALDILKSIRSRPNWKPSEEQMETVHTLALKNEKQRFIAISDVLFSLYNDLKKL